jgi:chemotaxis protein methyltransferase CheR
MDDQSFRQLLNHLGLSWVGYRKVRKGVQKRLARHMQKLACRTAEAYLLRLDSDQQARDECMRLMTVSISRFFRDRTLWAIMETDVLPSIIHQRPVRYNVWSAGCARGEEAYTFKIVWVTLAERFGPLPALLLWATDMHPDYVEQAKRGIYYGSSLRALPEATRDRYFRVRKRDRSWQIMDAVKEGINWQIQDLRSPPPYQAFHLVFLRNNLLTYYEEALKVPAFEKVVSSLAEGGYLVIGSHEKIPPGFPMLRPTGIHPCIFEKQGFGC